MEIIKCQKLINNSLFFPIVMWLTSRLTITIAMLVFAPLLPIPTDGMKATFSWDIFYAFDSLHYEKIATSGYNFSIHEKEYSVAFFPLFPLLIHSFMMFGLPFKVAGILVNNLAFLIALLVLYSWVNEFYSKSAARWTTAVFTWFPASLFCTVIYSEGLYLLFSTAALRAFDKKQSAWVALWGAIATAARPTGIALIPAFLLTSWQEKRGIKFYLASLATGGGLFIYSLYCQIKFGDALAFIHAQKAWRPSLGFDWQSWLRIIMQITIGPVNTVSGYLKDPWYPLLFMIIVISSYLLWYFRKILGSVKVDYGFYALILFLWLLGGDPLINAVPILGGAYLLWHLRTQLTPITLIYGFSALALILASGGTWSLNRIAYGIISLSVALGVLLSRYPRWGYMSIGFFAILVITFSIRFAQKLWVA